MNWRLIFRLSLVGLAMGLATVSLIPPKNEPLLWLIVFVISAYFIATQTTSKRLVHGLLVGLANCVWVTGSHIALFHRYLAHHPREAAILASTPMPDSPRLMMAIAGPVVGVLSGLLIGLLAVLIARYGRVDTRQPAATR